jgi:sec-independent protein translocase protein TatA
VVGDILQPTHLIFILLVALLVLGPKRLPEVGRSLGKGIRDFRGALSGLEDPFDTTATPPQTYIPPEPSVPPPPPTGVVAEAAVIAAEQAAAPAFDEPSPVSEVVAEPVATPTDVASLSANASKAARAEVDPADPSDYAD